MHSVQTFAFALFAGSALAVGDHQALGPKWKRARCNADNCLRAVRASPLLSTAANDCSSFLRMTVTPCAVTTTTTTTSTVVVDPIIVTVTASTDLTISSTAFETITTPVTTIVETTTVVDSVQTSVIDTIFTTVTVTALPAKRAARATTCTPITASSTDVPAYASACSGSARYSSACSCVGVTGATTTLSPVTSTETSTATTFVTPTVTATFVVTNTVTSVLSSTELIPTTISSDVTTTFTSVSTVTSRRIIPTTVVVSPPVCSTYNFVVTNGLRIGQFLTGALDQTEYNSVTFAINPAVALSYTIQSDGQVYTTGNGVNLYWITASTGFYYIRQKQKTDEALRGFAYVSCSIIPGTSFIPGSIGNLRCSAPAGSPIALNYCPQTSNNLVKDPTSSFPGCSQPDLAVVPNCA